MKLSEICKAIRTKKHWSQYELADAVGTNQTEISFIERGFVPDDQNKVSRIMVLARLTKAIY